MSAARARILHGKGAAAAAVVLLAVSGAVVGTAAQVVDSTAVADSLAGSPAASIPSDSITADSVLPAALGPMLSPEVVAYVVAMTDSVADTPFGMGYIPTGLVEARIAEAYARLAGRDSANVRAMTSNMTHVLHAIDPTLVTGRGSGLGYGFRRAAEAVRDQIARAAADPGASPTLQYHASYVENAATNALALADDAVRLARRIQASDGVSAAALLGQLEDLAELVRAMAYGLDRNRDGRIGNEPDEGGLATAGYHLELVRRVEQLPPVRPLPDGLPIPDVGRDAPPAPDR